MSEMTKEVSVTPVCASAFQALVESGPMSIAFPKAAKKLLRAPLAVSLCILTDGVVKAIGVKNVEEKYSA